MEEGYYDDFMKALSAHQIVDSPNWSTKNKCSCGEEFTSMCEFYKHAYLAMMREL